MPPIFKPSSPVAKKSWITRTAFSLLFLFLFSACGKAPWDINSATDRNSMMFEIRNDLTVMNCAPALTLAKQLFESSYSDNEIRMLYASAQGCNVGIQLYPLLDSISKADFSSFDAVMKTFVRLFPSRTALDSKLQSTWIIQDVLQSMLNPGTVIGASDQNVINAYNTGSVLYRDRTSDSNAFLVFTSMAGVGTSLNRYGYNASDDPASLGYAHVLPLPWLTKAAVLADTTHAGCSLASSLLNMFDGIQAVSGITSGAVSSAFSAILNLQTLVDAAGANECAIDPAPYTAQQCTDAAARLRYRDACFEQGAAAAYATGIIKAINAGWL